MDYRGAGKRYVCGFIGMILVAYSGDQREDERVDRATAGSYGKIIVE